MEELLTIEYSTSYGASLSTARRLTDGEKAHYAPAYRELMLIGTGNHIDLQYVKQNDMPRRPYDGEFNGCSNRAWIITPDEWDAYLALEANRVAATAEQAKLDEIAELEAQKASAEAQKDLPTAEEAARRVREWGTVQNEGGEGYIPHVYSHEEYERICARLEELHH